MDYFGSRKEGVTTIVLNPFQSFWVNGLLWKGYSKSSKSSKRQVSILLGQWITLEAWLIDRKEWEYSSFNPSGSMDYFGSGEDAEIGLQVVWVSILLGQWITLEVHDGIKHQLGRTHVSILLGQWITLEDFH